MDFSSLKSYLEGSSLEALSPVLQTEYFEQLRLGDFPRWRALLAQLPAIRPSTHNLDSTISIGQASDTDEATLLQLKSQLKGFIPWRKGPLELFNIAIDTEWRCDWKWDRLRSQISPLAGRKILDVGSGNGYYSLRMLQAGAERVIGVDPHIAYVAQFWLIKHFLKDIPVDVLPLALEDLPENSAYFDSVFSMGVLYHRRSPIDHLLQLKNSLKAGGELILETLFVDGKKGYSLTPENRYARMTNVWFVPSIATLENWLSRCGFVDIRVIDESTTTVDEQRKTNWMPFDSLEDALSKENPTQTTEGLPAPKRVVILASRSK
jgi:tRNA (mo5U34)-methyltransferase